MSFITMCTNHKWIGWRNLKIVYNYGLQTGGQMFCKVLKKCSKLTFMEHLLSFIYSDSLHFPPNAHDNSFKVRDGLQFSFEKNKQNVANFVLKRQSCKFYTFRLNKNLYYNAWEMLLIHLPPYTQTLVLSMKGQASF